MLVTMMSEGDGLFFWRDCMGNHETFTLTRCPVFAAGTWNDDTYTDADLDDMVSSYNALHDDFKPILKIHHGDNNENDKTALRPAFGVVSRLFRDGGTLFADFVDIPREVYEAIKHGALRRLSAEIVWDLKRAGRSFRRVLTGVALLGSDIPAVSGLGELQALYAAAYAMTDHDDLRRYVGVPTGMLLAYETIKEYEHEYLPGGMSWEDSGDNHVYWIYPRTRIAIDEIEDLGDGRQKVTGRIAGIESDDAVVVGYRFEKSTYSLDEAKAWVQERMYSIKEGTMPTKEDGKEKNTQSNSIEDALAKLNTHDFSTLPDDVQAMFKTITTDQKEAKQYAEEMKTKNLALEVTIEKERDIRLTKEFTDEAKSYSCLSIDLDEGVKAMKSIAQSNPDGWEWVKKTLHAADALVSSGKAFAEIGSSQGDAMGGAMEKINALAKTYVDTGKCKTMPEGVALAASENPELVQEYQTECAGRT